MEQSIRPFDQEVLVERRHLPEKWNGALFQKCPIAGMQPVVLIDLRKPCPTACPVLHVGLRIFFEATLGRHVERRQNAPAAEHVSGIRAEVVHALLEQIEQTGDTLGKPTWEGRPQGLLYIFVEEKHTPPRRLVVSVPDAL